MSQEGFEVTDAYELGSRSDVKEDRVVLPPTKHVLVRVDKASTRLVRPVTKGGVGTVRALNLQVRYPEGLEVVGENGEEPTRKYINKVDFIELEYQVVNAEARTEERYVGKNRSFLVPMTQFLAAIGIPPEQSVTINDEFLAELPGKQFYLDVGKREVNAFNTSENKWEKTGEFRNVYKNFQPA